MTKILAFAGKKQSGKSTGANFVFGLKMLSTRSVVLEIDETKRENVEVERPVFFNSFKINELGQLVVPTDQGEGVLDVVGVKPNMVPYFMENVWPFVKMYYFADILKQDICMNILGLTYEQCYGSEEEKNTKTQYKWDNMPGVTPSDVLKAKMNEYFADSEYLGTFLKPARFGPMTAREVMQYFGTDIFRFAYKDVWASSTLRRIMAEGSELAIIGDLRFPNEAEYVKYHDGKIIKLLRNSDSTDAHESEKALDKYDKFDWVLDNSQMTIEEQNKAIAEKVYEWGLIGECS